MNPWLTLAVQDLLNQFNDSELAAYNDAKGDNASPAGSALPDIIAKVADQIQLAYAQGGRFVDPVTQAVPAPGTIPPGEANRAIAIIRWKYLLALPTGKSLAENRADEAKKAEDYFLAVAKREIKVAGGVAIARPGRHVRTKSFDGLSQT